LAHSSFLCRYIEPLFKGKCDKLPLPCCKPKAADELGAGEKFFQDKVHPVLYKGRFVWFLVLAGVGGFFTYTAQFLQRPSTGAFQLFHAGHPMETYEMVSANKFEQGGISGSGNNAFFPVTFVWGLSPEDNGNHMDPSDFGTPDWHSDFSIKSMQAQQWLLDFCSDVREESWYQPLNRMTAK
jgi:hypothetical protein